MNAIINDEIRDERKAQITTLTIGGRVVELPELDDVAAYMHYLEVRDSIMDTENKSGLYTAKQFRDMIDCLVELYGNQFTAEEVMAKDGGLTVSEIVFAFSSVEVGVAKAISGRVEAAQENFTKRA